MLGFLKDLLEKECSLLEEKIKLKEAEKVSIKEKSDRIQAYLKDRDVCTDTYLSKLYSLAFVALAAGLLTSLCLPSGMAFIVMISLLLGCPIFFWNKRQKKQLKMIDNQYSEFSNIKIEELKKLENELLCKEYEISQEIIVLLEKQVFYLDKILEIKTDINYFKYCNEIPILKADSEEEYKLLKSLQEENLKNLDDYLNEKIDYSSVHFNNSYNESSKQLIKKM